MILFKDQREIFFQVVIFIPGTDDDRNRQTFFRSFFFTAKRKLRKHPPEIDHLYEKKTEKSNVQVKMKRIRNNLIEEHKTPI